MKKIWAITVSTCREFISWKKLLLLNIPFIYYGLFFVVLQVVYRNWETKQIYTFISFFQSMAFFMAGLLPIIKLYGDVRQNRLQTVLTKPVRCWQLLAGILSGCLLFMFGFILAMDIFLQIMMLISGIGWDSRLHLIMLFSFFGCIPLIAFTLFLSILIRPVSAGITVFLFQPGSLESFAKFIDESHMAAIYKMPLVFMLDALSYVFPQMNEFRLQEGFYVYKIVELYRLFWALFYASDYAVIMILITAYILSRRDIVKGE